MNELESVISKDDNNSSKERKDFQKRKRMDMFVSLPPGV